MPTKAQPFVVHPAQGGLDVTTAATLLPPDWLQTANNVEYFNPGSRKKRPGTTRQNATAIDSSTSTITGLHDFWRNGIVSPGQRFVASAGNRLYEDVGGTGTWTSIMNTPSSMWGSNAAAVTIFTAQNQAIFFNDLGSEAPLRYTGGALVPLTASNTKAYPFGVYHLRRIFAVDPSNQSYLDYSAAGDITDFSGADTGTLRFDEDDGDRIMGISKSFRGSLYIFKGPNLGSIHELSGRQQCQFAHDRMLDTAPCIAHRSVLTTTNDIYWMSSYGFHSLSATQKYGNTEEAFISHRITSLVAALQTPALDQVVSFYHPTRNCIGWFVPEAGQTQNTALFVYNYVLGLWSVWRFSGFNGASCMIAKTPLGAGTGRPRLYIGGYNGFIRAGDQTTLTDDQGSAYEYRAKWANNIRLGEGMNELVEKSFQSVTTFFNPTATGASAQLNVTIDGRLSTHTVNLQSSGSTFGSGVFGTATYGGAGTAFYVETPIEGRGRAIELEYVQGGANQDCDLYGYAVRAVPGEAISMEHA
jgi:hypothetical protein